jgi:lipopolysaccharide transport system permease protein
VADINPIYHFIQIVRMPLMGQVPEAHTYYFVLAFIAVSFLIALPFLVANRHKISLWV